MEVPSALATQLTPRIVFSTTAQVSKERMCSTGACYYKHKRLSGWIVGRLEPLGGLLRILQGGGPQLDQDLHKSR